MIRFVSLLALSFALAAPLAAQEPDPDELDALRRRIEARQAESERLTAEARERAEEAAQLQREVIEAAAALRDQEAAVAAVEARMEGLAKETRDAERDLAARRGAYSDVLAALQSLELSRPPALAVRPDDAAEAARIGLLLADAAPVLQERAEALRVALDRLRALEKDAASERVRLASANTELSARRDVLSDLLSRKVAERDAATRLAEETQAEISRLAAQASSLSDLIGRLERFKRAVAPRVKPDAPMSAGSRTTAAPAPRRKPRALEPFTPATRFADARGRLPAPVGGPIVARFGDRRDIGGGRVEGLVFEANSGALVTAPFAGKIVFARDWANVGNVLILDVGGGFHVIVIGADQFLASEGATVQAGEPVGAMAAGTPAPELYLEIRKNSEPVDPAVWLAQA